MTKLLREDDVLSQASKWVVLNSSIPLDGDTKVRFETWLQSDPRHAKAYQQLSDLWSQLGQADPARLKKNIARKRTRHIATLIFMASCSGWLASALLTHTDTRHVLSSSAQIRQLILADGSRVTLDVNSEILPEINATQRKITLIKGRAMFDVVPSNHELPPFTVVSPQLTATALGTRFDVSFQNNETIVRIYQHNVRVACPVCNDKPNIIFGPGDVIQTKDNFLTVTHHSDTYPDATWDKGMIVFNEAPMTHVVKQLQHYSRKRIVLLGSNLKKLKISGTARTQDVPGALTWLLTHSKYRVSEWPGVIIVH